MSLTLRRVGGLFHVARCSFSSSIKPRPRPSTADVERISKGERARKRGVGSRLVPHRLNEAERKEFEVAKRRGFVSLRNTGWRAARSDSPLANLFMLYCDARGQPCISLQRGVHIDAANTLGDTVVVDLSPLRTLDLTAQAAAIVGLLPPPSRDGMIDRTDVAACGLDSSAVSRSLLEDPIWKVPALAITASFGVRADAKAFAAAVAGMRNDLQL